ncbi:MAG: acyltransferase [Nocardia sp.]|nr:acyltransferase [Nocardia sp.]
MALYQSAGDHTGEQAAAPPAAAPPERIARPYLHQMDLFRVVTFACVVGSHVVAGTTAPPNVTANAALLLLHYTRLGFFSVTGFLLVYQYAHRPFTAGQFWRRRFGAVGIPYLAWSVLYWAFSLVLEWVHQLPGGETPRGALWRLVCELVAGTGWYQLYFLLVTLQVYLLFPALARLLRATVGRHRWVLAGSGALHLVCMWVLMHPPMMSGTTANIWGHVVSMILPYQFYTVLGALAAWHIDTIRAVVDRYGAALIALAVAGVAFAEWEYLRALHHGLPPWDGTNVFQPHLTITYIAIIVGLYALGTAWARVQHEHRVFGSVVRYGADRSFGVFLTHPFVLQLLAPWVVPTVHAFGQFWGTTVLYLAVLAGSLLMTEVIRRLPVSKWLTGKPKAHTDFSALRPRPAVDPHK